jgi:hypothetical protein
MNLCLSLQTAYSARMLMMSQSRLAARDRFKADNHHEIDRRVGGEVRAGLDHLSAQDDALGLIRLYGSPHRRIRLTPTRMSRRWRRRRMGVRRTEVCATYKLRAKFRATYEGSLTFRATYDVLRRLPSHHGRQQRPLAPACRALGIVGEHDEVLQNRDAFRFFDEIAGDGRSICHTAGALRSGKRVWGMAKLPGDIIAANGDAVQQFILLSNSHDGESAVQATLRAASGCRRRLDVSLAAVRGARRHLIAVAFSPVA